jgi:phosphopantetheine adenylyltransferase
MDRMKDYRQLIKELPSTTLVCALGDFDPPTTAHELLVKTVNRLAEQKNTDHVIYASTKDSLIQEDKKEQYLKLMFPKTKFKSVNESKISNLLEELSKKYKKIVIVAGSEQVAGLKKLVKENTQIIAINEKNPDSNYTKMKQLATKGLYEEFKKKLPSTIRELDGRRLMNDVRVGLGLEPVKEQLVLVKDKLREQYFRGEIFNEGDIVESNGEQFTIVKRGSNHLLLKEESGKLVSKWIQDVKPMEDKAMNEGVIQPNGSDKLDVSTSDTGAKAEPKPTGKVKGFITFYNFDTKDKLKESHLTGAEPIKIATSKSDDDADGESDEDDNNQKLHTYDPSEVGHTLVPGSDTKGSHHLRRMKTHYHREEVEPIEELSTDLLARYKTGAAASAKSSDASGDYKKGDKRFSGMLKATRKQFDNDLKKHGQFQEEELEEAKKKAVCPDCGKHVCECGEERPGIGTDSTMSKDPFFKEDFTDQEIDEMVNSVTDEDIEDLYEEDELVLVYDDDGEEIPPLQEESKYDLMEVLSRSERMRGKIRLRKTSAKRGRSTKIALKRFSNPTTINKRARRLAIKLMKKRMLRGRDYSKISVGEKERIEKVMAKRKDVIGRIAQKLVSRVRKVEKSRMSHGKVTKGSMPSVF